MTWYANQIYAKPTAEVIAAFRTQPFFEDQLYHVDDFRGVRSPLSRKMLLSRSPPRDGRDMRHGLPAGGLLVVSLEIRETRYGRGASGVADSSRDNRQQARWPHWPPGAKWASVHPRDHTEPFFPPALDREHFSFDLLRFLKWVRTQTASSMVYYQCAMWGGTIENETAWIVDGEERVYQFKNDSVVIEHTANGTRSVDGEVLPLAMRHVGLDLPTSFFALHETTFDWKVYRMEAV